MFAIASALALLSAVGAAQVVRQPPAGARVVTVLLCDQPDGCPAAARALADHAAGSALPILDFDQVAAVALAGEVDQRQYRSALSPVLDGRATLAQALDAQEALRALPFTVPAAQAQAIDLVLAWRLLEAGRADEARLALDRAASGSQGSVTDLPDLPDELLQRYYDAVDRLRAAPGRLTIEASGPAGEAFIDGRPAGPTPVVLTVAPGWHRVTAERVGRRTAWVGEVRIPPGRALRVLADLSPDDGVDSAEASLLAATEGQGAPPQQVQDRLAAWATEQGLRWLRFVCVVPEDSLRAQVPEERFVGPDGSRWASLAIWLDVDTARLTPDGPGPLALAAGAGAHPFSAHVGLGMTRLGPRDHTSIELSMRLRLLPLVAAEARVGVLRAGVDYYLYDEWIDPHLFPIALGARLGRDEGPSVGLQALLVIPYALGAQATAGWTISPGARWRLGLEARGGWTDHGGLAGGQFVLGRVR